MVAEEKVASNISSRYDLFSLLKAKSPKGKEFNNAETEIHVLHAPIQ